MNKWDIAASNVIIDSVQYFDIIYQDSITNKIAVDENLIVISYYINEGHIIDTFYINSGNNILILNQK